VSFDRGRPCPSNKLLVNALVYALVELGKARTGTDQVPH
jgi:hypothetical protein